MTPTPEITARGDAAPVMPSGGTASSGARLTAAPRDPLVTLHRYAAAPTDGDLAAGDLAAIWNIMEAENLVETFFHDGSVSGYGQFHRYATSPANWFYAARRGGAFIGLGVVNNFSSSGNTAYAHLLSFRAGRLAGRSLESPFAEAGRQWFALLRDVGGLDTLVAVLPGCYRGARRWAALFGFAECMRLPGALRVARRQGFRVTDAVVCRLALAEAPLAAQRGAGEAGDPLLPVHARDEGRAREAVPCGLYPRHTAGTGR